MASLLSTRVFPEREIRYDGRQLTAHWIYRELNVLGDAVVAFAGPCDVKLSEMVDLIDVKSNAPIYSPKMLHFIGEWFRDSFDEGILLQNLLVCQVYEALLERGIRDLSRRGNDMFYKERKLSVSIATKTPVSVVAHLALNIEIEGTPVPTSGLNEMGVQPFALATDVLQRFARDYSGWRTARVKVTPR